MKKYEAMFLIDSDVAAKSWDEAKAHILEVVQKHDGEMLDLEPWEERKLAYPIKKRRKGTYILGHFNIPPEKVNVIRDEFKISETILRHIFVTDAGKRQFLAAEDQEDTNGRSTRRRKPQASTEPAATDDASAPAEKAPAPAAEPVAAAEELPKKAEKKTDDGSLEDPSAGESQPIVE